MAINHSQIPDCWNMGLIALVNTKVGVVRTTIRVVLQPFESKPLQGLLESLKIASLL